MLQLKPERFDLADAIAQPLSVCGRQLIADNSGALYWPAQRTLLVADPHLADRPAGANGRAQPAPSDARQTLIRLAEVMDRYEPARVIVLSDAMHDGGLATRMAAESLEILDILQEEREWIWLTGQPDADIAPRLGGRARGTLQISGLTLRHRPTRGWATHEIGAHLKPAAHLCLYGYSIRRGCFVGNGRRLVMPAFGTPTIGLNVLDEAFRPLFGSSGMSVWMLGSEGLYPVATRLLAGD